jgi:CheY-like chemotaxis protein
MPNPYNVLLVEPDSSVRQALGEALASESYGVALAASGGEAVRQLEQSKDIDAVVVDLPLGVSHARHVLDRLRRVQPNLPMIVLTTTRGHAEVHWPRPGVALLEKPLDLPLLFKTLRMVTAGPVRPGLRAEVSPSSCPL